MVMYWLILHWKLSIFCHSLMLEKTESKLGGAYHSFSSAFIMMPLELAEQLGHCKMQLVNNLQNKLLWFMHFLQEKLNVTKECVMTHRNWGDVLTCLLLQGAGSVCCNQPEGQTAVQNDLCHLKNRPWVLAIPVSPVRALPHWFMHLGLSTEHIQETKQWHFIVCLYRNEISDSQRWLFQTHDNEMALFFYSPVSVNSLEQATYSLSGIFYKINCWYTLQYITFTIESERGLNPLIH